MGIHPDSDSNLPREPEGETRYLEGPEVSDTREEREVSGLVRKPDPPDDFLRHSRPLRPEGYFIFHRAHGQ